MEKGELIRFFRIRMTAGVMFYQPIKQPRRGQRPSLCDGKSESCGPKFIGGVAEWSKALVSKTSVGQPTVSSNLTSSAFARRSGELRRTKSAEDRREGEIRKNVGV